MKMVFIIDNYIYIILNKTCSIVFFRNKALSMDLLGTAPLI